MQRWISGVVGQGLVAAVLAVMACGGAASSGGSTGTNTRTGALDPNWFDHAATSVSATLATNTHVKMKAPDSDYVYDGLAEQDMVYTVTALAPALLFSSFAQRARAGKQFLVIPVKLTLINVLYPKLTNVVSSPMPAGFKLVPSTGQCTASDQLLRSAQSDTPSLDSIAEDAGFYTLLGQALHLRADVPAIPAQQTSGTDTGALIFVVDPGATQIVLDCKMMDRSGSASLHQVYRDQTLRQWNPPTP